jgi:DNA-binding GntR family transcriptional regulator
MRTSAGRAAVEDAASEKRNAPAASARKKETAAQTPVRQRMTARDIAKEVMRLIDRQVYHPGDRLREQEIADRFKVSRGPVREALRILEAKTVIHIEPMRGATVVRMNDEETVVAVEISGVLFGLAVRRSTKFATPAQKRKILAEANKLGTLAVSEISPKDFFWKTVELGALISETCNSPRLQAQLVDARIGAPNMFGPLGFLTKDIRRRAASRWIAMAKAVVDDDAEKAERLAVLIHEEACRNALDVGV